MRIDFSPILQRDLAGIGSIIQGVTGAAQAIGGAIREHKNTKKVEDLANNYKPNQGILDYYNKALQKYNVNPYQTNLYKMQEQQSNRGLASGIGALQSRGQALAGINSLVQGRNDSLLKAGAQAEQMQGQDLNRLAGATAMKAQEEKYPFEMKYNLYSAKAGGGAQQLNAGLANLYGAGSSMSQMAMLNKMYGSGSSGSTSAALGGSGMGAASYGNSVLQDLYRNQNRRVG